MTLAIIIGAIAYVVLCFIAWAICKVGGDADGEAP